MTKNIRVSDEIHAKVAEIAEINYRGLGDQVSYWADTACTHPEDKRVLINGVVSPVMEPVKGKAAQVGKGQLVRGFFCSHCGQTVLSADANEEIKAALSAPVLGVIK